MRCVDSYFLNVTSLLATEPNSANSTENTERARTEPTENDGRLRFVQIPDRLKYEYLHILLGMASFVASERIRWKTTKKRWKHLFSHYKYMGVIFRRSTTDNSILMVEFGQNSLGVMHVPKTYKFKMDQIKSNQD